MSRWLIVGLGNPGPTYANTRHNIGFWAVDALANTASASFSLSGKHRAAVATVRLSGMDEPVYVAKPTTYMNESGLAVGKICRFYQIPPEQVIVIHDELDLDPGRLRVKFGGGDNGHNGLRSIRAHLGTGDFFRVRLGIGRPVGNQPAADYVLSQLPKRELENYLTDAAIGADAAEMVITDGLEATQNRYNN